ncbi:MAG: bifunctional tRNA (5-methylaminomethyl-2-thiouridine)(34)-methyltransferase MnmD/FAD-dependent 5-carboxymethylaminomethyl-2-thiouridine(34) oxidoreductase MnmC, partial [Gammaproteobacteria bacterium]
HNPPMPIDVSLVQPACLQWHDGEPYSEAFGDIYYSRDDGLDESAYVFIANSGLPDRWKGVHQFTIGELGFGTGLNFLMTAKLWRENRRPGQTLHFLSIERFPLTANDLRTAVRRWPALTDELERLLQVYPPLIGGVHRCPLGDGLHLTLVFADVRDGLAEVKAEVDAWYLDGFDPKRNPDMWSETTLGALADISAEGATVSTFSVAGKVRRGLEAAGFQWEKVPGHGRKSQMLVARNTAAIGPGRESAWFAACPSRRRPGSALIIGAGVAGCATASTLADAGWAVTLVERGSGPASGASGTPVAAVYPVINAAANDYETFYLRAFGLFSRWMLGAPESDRYWRQTGVEHCLSRQELARRRDRLNHEPGLAEWMRLDQAAVDFCEYPRAGVLAPLAWCESLVSQCDLVTGFQVQALSAIGGQWQVSSTQGKTLTADVVVLAAGHDSTRLKVSENYPLTPAGGQVDLFPSRSGQARDAARIGDGYLIPDGQGGFWVGAAFHRGRIMDHPDARESEANRARAEGLMMAPGSIEGEPLQSWCGTRATTPDRLPLLGPVISADRFREKFADLHLGRPPEQYAPVSYLPGLFINTGHGARGMVAAAMSAEVIRSELTGEPWPLERSLRPALLAHRFVFKELRRGRVLLK